MDQCWGAGKASLAWKFRRILQKNPELESKLPPEQLKILMSAVYLHIRFDYLMIPHEFWDKVSEGKVTDDDYDAIICHQINLVLEASGQRGPHKVRTKIADILGYMHAEAPGTYFLFHFDEMKQYSKRMIHSQCTMTRKSPVMAGVFSCHDRSFFFCHDRSFLS